ncbi:MAG: pseudouridine synthase [Bacillota bacterium]|nr:pseudouridine synthase [Bacillota bacterium]
MEEIRLQKYLADAGIASRRKSEELINRGIVKVNGVIINHMGFKVKEGDIVEVNDSVLHIGSNKIYVMLNKPAGYVSTSKDQFSRKSVVDLVDVNERIYPVGRLDYDTSGLILLTNDGDFTYKMTHPKHEMKKVYIALIEGIPDEKQLTSFKNGLMIEDYITSPAKIRIINKYTNKAKVEIIIHEGKNRQVRKMCDAIGHPVLELKRVAIGDLSLGELKEGQWRHLTKEELEKLK